MKIQCKNPQTSTNVHYSQKAANKCCANKLKRTKDNFIIDKKILKNNNHPTLTKDTLESFYNNPRWLGFGYLGIRENARSLINNNDPDKEQLIQSLEEADNYLLETVNSQNWSNKDLFRWANSKNGRWYGEIAIYCNDINRVTNLIKKP